MQFAFVVVIMIIRSVTLSDLLHRQLTISYLAEKSGATGLDGLDLGQINRGSSESERKLGKVESNALGRQDGAELRA